MKEQDVREALYNSEIRRITLAQPLSLIIDELGILEGKCRVDLAVINDRLHGYEIKSASDNLARLLAQQEHYGKVFDLMTLVADQSHVEEAVKLVPKWWGLIAATTQNGCTVLNEIWPPMQNRQVDPYSLCQLLWREEALAALVERGLDWGVRTKARKYIWQTLARELPVDELRTIVRDKMTARTTWRQAPRRRRRRKRRSKSLKG